jgi:plastocyanin
MEFSPEVNGRLKTKRRSRACAATLYAVAVALLIASAGCGKKGAVHDESAVTPASDSTSAANAGKSAKAGDAHSEAGSSGATNRVVLTEKGCVQFEPSWATVQVGQPVTWHSELKSPVTIHVSPGGFDRSEFVVQPGTSASSGPARSAGSYSIWTDPAACQGSARGVQGSGPGVKVEGGTSSR